MPESPAPAAGDLGASNMPVARPDFGPVPGTVSHRIEVQVLMSSSPHFLTDRLAEAARYALMRRLLPAIRHDIAGSLQPIGMMAAMLEKRAKSASPNLAQLANSSQALQLLARETTATLLNLTTWLAPKDNNLVAVGPAVAECLSLIATELSFRGFSISDQTAGLDMQLHRSMLRSVFTASLIALTDACGEPACVVVTAGTGLKGKYLQIALQAVLPETTDLEDRLDGPALRNLQPQMYRGLGWDDVEALAAAEGVRLLRDGNTVRLDCSQPAH